MFNAQVPSQHSEKFGMGRMESGVSLFSRQVMIQQQAKILPDWLRFIKGVIDSPDVPLNLSREYLQDSALIKSISRLYSQAVLMYRRNWKCFDPQTFKILC